MKAKLNVTNALTGALALGYLEGLGWGVGFTNLNHPAAGIFILAVTIVTSVAATWGYRYVGKRFDETRMFVFQPGAKVLIDGEQFRVAGVDAMPDPEGSSMIWSFTVVKS